MKLGIDFGTTRTVVSVLDRGNTPVVGFDTPGGDVVDAWPTLAATDGQRWVFGPQAAERLGQPGWQGLRSFKRLLSGPGATADRVVDMGDRPTVRSLLTRFLVALRQDLLKRSNLPGADTATRLEVLAAVPAAATSAQRFQTMTAFREAGFDVLGVLNEPSAAGIEYAARYRRTLNSKRGRVLVYDLGGGTFDATIVALEDGRHTVEAHAGLDDLGGDDLDRALLDLALSSAALDPAALSDAASVTLLEHCRQLKESLHPSTRSIVVELGAHLSGPARDALGVQADMTVRVSVADFEAQVGPLIQPSLDLVERLVGPTGLEGRGIAGVYVVGGASSLPLIARTLRQVFGRRVHRSAYPSAATAIGLATALADDDLVLHERLSRAFGVFRELDTGSDVAFDLIFDPATPTRGAEVTRRYRPAHNIGHFRFAECSSVDALGTPVGDIVPIGEQPAGQLGGLLHGGGDGWVLGGSLRRGLGRRRRGGDEVAVDQEVAHAQDRGEHDQAIEEAAPSAGATTRARAHRLPAVEADRAPAEHDA